MKLKAAQRVSIHIARERALAALSGRPLPAAWVADKIWPDHEMTRQGAGAAASRVLKTLEKDGLAAWRSTRTGWGWVVRTTQGEIDGR